MFAVLVLVQLTSLLVAIYRTGQLRAMAIGFFIFSAGYLLVEGNYWPGSPGARLPTNDIINWFWCLAWRISKGPACSNVFARSA